MFEDESAEPVYESAEPVYESAEPVYESADPGIPDASASLTSGTWEAIKSGAYAVGDLAEAGYDVGAAGVNASVGVVGHVSAGILDAVGAEETAAGMRDGANVSQDMAWDDLRDAGKELGEVKDDLL